MFVLYELKWFGIVDRLMGVTIDNASNNYKMNEVIEDVFANEGGRSSFERNVNQFECVAHVINLVCQEIFKSTKRNAMAMFSADGNDSNVLTALNSDTSDDTVVQAIARLSFVLRKIRISPLQKSAYQQALVLMKLKKSTPIIDVATRWNSTYDMLAYAVANKAGIDQFMLTFKQTQTPTYASIVLGDNHWDTVKTLIGVLKKMKSITEKVSSQSVLITKYVYILLMQSDDRAIFYFQSIDTHMSKSIQELDSQKDEDLIDGLKAGQEKLRHYYDQLSPIVTTTILLTPHMGKPTLEKLWNGLEDSVEWVATALTNLETLFASYVAARPTPIHLPSKRVRMKSFK
jgi:hypothetical protein